MNGLFYKKVLSHVLFEQTITNSKKELQEVLFFDESTTDSWSLKKCRIQYVKDQIQFYESGNLEVEVEEFWNEITDNENKDD